MLDAFRTHKRWLMFIAMVLIIPSFVVTGIYSYNRMRESDHSIAKVGKTSITPSMYDQAKREQLDSLRQQLGDNFHPNMLDNPEARKALVTGLMDRVTLDVALNKEHVGASEQEAIAVIKAQPLFLKDGKFDPELYQRFLQSQGKSDAMFVNEVRFNLARQKLTQGVAGTAIVPESLTKNLFQILTTEREVQTLIFNADEYLNKVSVTDEEAQKYYDEHKNDFIAPEHVNVQYVVLTPDAFKDSIKIDESALKTYYEQNKSHWAQPETRQASHILITANGDDAKAKAKAEEIVKELQAHPDEFAAIAKKESQDPGSAANGGDLGTFAPSAMVPEFDKAVFAAKVGEIVGPVKTQFGYHIIKVTGINGGKTLPFAEVKDEIAKQYVKEMEMREFAEKAEDFTNTVYEQSDSLEPVADKFGLKVYTADMITRQGVTNDQLKPFFNAHVVDALFDRESLEEKRNTSAIEVSPNTLVSARVVKYVPKAVRSFDEVKATIIQGLKIRKATELAKEAGEAFLKDVKVSKKLDKFSKAVWVSQTDPKGFPLELIKKIDSVPVKSLPAFEGNVVGGAYIITYISAAKDRTPTKDDLETIKRQLTQIYGQEALTGWRAELRQKYDARIVNPDFIQGPKTDDQQQ